MDLSWIFWNFVIPTIGSFVLPLLITSIFLGGWDRAKLEQMFRGRKYLGFVSPQGILYYSLAGSSLAFYTYWSTEAAQKPDLGFVSSVIMMLICVVVLATYYIGFYLNRIETWGAEQLPKNPLMPDPYWIGVCMFLALVSGVISLGAYEWRSALGAA